LLINEEDYLAHVGVLGMRWHHRKREETSSSNGPNFEIDSLTIKRGQEIHRLSNTPNEVHKGSGYASFLKEDVETYNTLGKVFSKCGMKQFDMTLVAKKNLVSPSQKERVDVFLKKMDDPAFAKELRKTQARMFVLNMISPQDVKLAFRHEKLSLRKANAYRMLNQAISGNKTLRSQYLDEFKKMNYDFIPDEGDITNKQSKAPIIFIEREHSLAVVKVEEL
jgi:hypothetical protein